MSGPKLKVGEWYYVVWYDAMAAFGDNPRDAAAALRRNALRFERTVQRTWGKHDLTFHVFCMGHDEDDQTNAGYFAMPDGMLIAVESIPPPKTPFPVKGD